MTTLAEPWARWWPAILVFLQTGSTNAGTEGTILWTTVALADLPMGCWPAGSVRRAR